MERFHPDLLPTTHLHLAQQMEMQGKYRAAEVHFLAVGDWKAATNMYRTLGMWEEAYRVAKQSGGSAAANQVAFLWAKTLPIDSAIKLLNKYGILEACVDYACETYQYEFAFQLCKNLQSKVSSVVNGVYSKMCTCKLGNMNMYANSALMASYLFRLMKCIISTPWH